MEQDKKSGNNGYELRKAAGLYWLLDLRQDGEHYKPPLAMNEMDWRLRRTAYLGDCGVYAFGPRRFPMLTGTAQRLSIACTILRKSPILLLDEGMQSGTNILMSSRKRRLIISGYSGSHSNRRRQRWCRFFLISCS